MAHKKIIDSVKKQGQVAIKDLDEFLRFIINESDMRTYDDNYISILIPMKFDIDKVFGLDDFPGSSSGRSGTFSGRKLPMVRSWTQAQYSLQGYRFCIERAQGSLGKPAIREIIEIPLRAYANGVE